MAEFGLQSWAAIAPGLESADDWRGWLAEPRPISEALGKIDLSTLPPMLRRRFNTLGKCAMGAALPLVDGIGEVPALFATRHGDTELTFSLLEDLGCDAPLSPTSFSLAVHNAVAGLFSIARKDTSEINVISATRGLVRQTFFEALGQLQQRESLLCVIYDVPLPEFYRLHDGVQELPFAYAIAMLLNREAGERFEFTRVDEAQSVSEQNGEAEQIGLLRLLTGLSDELLLSQDNPSWRISRIAD